MSGRVTWRNTAILGSSVERASCPHETPGWKPAGQGRQVA